MQPCSNPLHKKYDLLFRASFNASNPGSELSLTASLQSLQLKAGTNHKLFARIARPSIQNPWGTTPPLKPCGWQLQPWQRAIAYSLAAIPSTKSRNHLQASGQNCETVHPKTDKNHLYICALRLSASTLAASIHCICPQPRCNPFN